MPCYHLTTQDPRKPLVTIARDRVDALTFFGNRLGYRLTLDETEDGIEHLMDEWPERSGPHCTCPTIPVYVSI